MLLFGVLCCPYSLASLLSIFFPLWLNPDLPQAAGITDLIECSIVADEDMYGANPNERKQYLQECQTKVNDLYMNLHSVFVSPTPGDPTGHLVHPWCRRLKASVQCQRAICDRLSSMQCTVAIAILNGQNRIRLSLGATESGRHASSSRVSLYDI